MRTMNDIVQLGDPVGLIGDVQGDTRSLYDVWLRSHLSLFSRVPAEPS